MSNNINQMLDSLMKNIDIVSNTQKVIGDVISMDDGTIIVPVSKVSMGFGGGGSDFGTQDKPSSGGGIGGGIKVTPEAFLVINNGNVRLIPMDGGGPSPLNKAIDMIPGLIDKVNGFITARNAKREDKAE